jgi:hypothetical protein
MQHATLISGYFAIGLICGGFVLFPAPERNARTLGSALVMVVLWPLWAPFALTKAPGDARGPLASRIASALDHATNASSLTGHDTVLRRSETALLLRRVEAAERRLGELQAQLIALGREEPGLAGVDPDAKARAQIRASSVAQLEAHRAREHAALVELAELCELLRTQHLLSRFGGSDRASELRDELWTRVQALSELDA